MAGLLHGRAKVLQQVPAIGDFQGVRCGLLDGLAVSGGTVPANDLGAGMRSEPGGEGVALAVGQDVDDAAGFDVDQQRAVPLSLLEREVVDTEDARRPFWDGWLRKQAQQPGPARLQPQPPAQPLTGTTTELDRDRVLPLLRSEAGAAVPLAELGDLLDERPPRTSIAVAEEPPDP